MQAKWNALKTDYRVHSDNGKSGDGADEQVVTNLQHIDIVYQNFADTANITISRNALRRPP